MNLNEHTGFILEKLVLKMHPVFGDNFEINFIEKKDFEDTAVYKAPYSSLIIGPNGTGKSLLLKSISDIFLDLNNLKSQLESSEKTKQRKHTNDYFLIKYYIGGESFEIANFDDRTNFDRKRRKFKYSCKINGIPVDNEELSLALPNTIIVSSLLLTDRFTVYKNSPPLYKYLGVRSLTSPTTAGTRNYVKRTVDLVVNSLSDFNTEISYKIKQLLEFLEFKNTFTIQYTPKYKSKFFDGNLTTEKFIQLFRNFSDVENGFSKRKNLTFIPFGVQYFDNHVLNVKGLVDELVAFLNEIHDTNKLVRKSSSKTEIFEYDILKSELSLDKYELLNHLLALDLITFPSIRLQKSESVIDLEQTSSGEYHIISNLIGIYASISQNSIVMLDEPEISLHPNWQMKYMSFLKTLFVDYSSCHFVVTTHSHFFASDLDGNTSKIIGLKSESRKVGIVDLPKNVDTFGWSAEEVLYRIFGLRTTRNHYFEYDITELASLIQTKSNESEKLTKLIEKLEKYKFSENDPLSYLMDMGYKLLNANNA